MYETCNIATLNVMTEKLGISTKQGNEIQTNGISVKVNAKKYDATAKIAQQAHFLNTRRSI